MTTSVRIAAQKEKTVLPSTGNLPTPTTHNTSRSSFPAVLSSFPEIDQLMKMAASASHAAFKSEYEKRIETVNNQAATFRNFFGELEKILAGQKEPSQEDIERVNDELTEAFSKLETVILATQEAIEKYLEAHKNSQDLAAYEEGMEKLTKLQNDLSNELREMTFTLLATKKEGPSPMEEDAELQCENLCTRFMQKKDEFLATGFPFSVIQELFQIKAEFENFRYRYKKLPRDYPILVEGMNKILTNIPLIKFKYKVTLIEDNFLLVKTKIREIYHKMLPPNKLAETLAQLKEESLKTINMQRSQLFTNSEFMWISGPARAKEAKKIEELITDVSELFAQRKLSVQGKRKAGRGVSHPAKKAKKEKN